MWLQGTIEGLRSDGRGLIAYLRLLARELAWVSWRSMSGVQLIGNDGGLEHALIFVQVSFTCRSHTVGYAVPYP